MGNDERNGNILIEIKSKYCRTFLTGSLNHFYALPTTFESQYLSEIDAAMSFEAFNMVMDNIKL